VSDTSGFQIPLVVGKKLQVDTTGIIAIIEIIDKVVGYHSFKEIAGWLEGYLLIGCKETLSPSFRKRVIGVAPL
jgi:hypothetical protein